MSDEEDKTPVDPILDFEVPADHVTPTLTAEVCPECGGGPDRVALVRLADWIPPPRTAEEAWDGWKVSCVSNQSGTWYWCVRTGWFTGRVRVCWERRRVKREPKP